MSQFLVCFSNQRWLLALSSYVEDFWRRCSAILLCSELPIISIKEPLYWPKVYPRYSPYKRSCALWKKNFDQRLECAFLRERYIPVANLVLVLLAESVLHRHWGHASLAVWHHRSRPITMTILGVLDHCVALKVMQSDRNRQLQRWCCRDSFTFQMSERLLTAIVHIHCFPASAWNPMRSTCVRCFIL